MPAASNNPNPMPFTPTGVPTGSTEEAALLAAILDQLRLQSMAMSARGGGSRGEGSSGTGKAPWRGKADEAWGLAGAAAKMGSGPFQSLHSALTPLGNLAGLPDILRQFTASLSATGRKGGGGSGLGGQAGQSWTRAALGAAWNSGGAAGGLSRLASIFGAGQAAGAGAGAGAAATGGATAGVAGAAGAGGPVGLALAGLMLVGKTAIETAKGLKEFADQQVEANRKYAMVNAGYAMAYARLEFDSIRRARQTSVETQASGTDAARAQSAAADAWRPVVAEVEGVLNVLSATVNDIAAVAGILVTKFGLEPAKLAYAALSAANRAAFGFDLPGGGREEKKEPDRWLGVMRPGVKKNEAPK